MLRAKPRISAAIRARLKSARVARLATRGPAGALHLVPVCFVFDDAVFYTALDRKPKRVAPKKLTRVRNIVARPRVALLIDEYREDWSELWFVLVHGRAKLVSESARKERERALRLLRRKYSQYAAGMLPDDAPVMRITVERMTAWGRDLARG